MDPAILARVKASLGDDVDVLLAKKLVRVGCPGARVRWPDTSVSIARPRCGIAPLSDPDAPAR